VGPRLLLRLILSILLLAGLPGTANAQSDATEHAYHQLRVLPEGATDEATAVVLLPAPLLLDYLAANGVVSPVIEGRIAALGDVPASP
jgi:hypothetical protein